jgi:hypothetical protein
MLTFTVIVVTCSSYAYADCGSKTLLCVENKGLGKEAGKVKMGQCFELTLLKCDDCPHTNYGKYARECNESYGSQCKEHCYVCSPADGSSFSGELTCYDSEGKGHTIR